MFLKGKDEDIYSISAQSAKTSEWIIPAGAYVNKRPLQVSANQAL